MSNTSFFKIFMKSKKTSEFVFVNYNSEEKEYYSFLKEEKAKGLFPLLLNSKILMDLLTVLFNEKKYTISTISFAEEDVTYEKRIDKLISESNEDRTYFFHLSKELDYLMDEESVEILCVAVRCKTDFIMLQSNGIVKIKTINGLDKTEEVKYMLTEILEQEING